MPIWKNSKMSTLYYSDEAASEDWPCVVKIDDREVLVEYNTDEEKYVQYRGENNGSGHFQLQSMQVDGRASLHMFPGSVILEGSWIEGSYRGMWRIKLG